MAELKTFLFTDICRSVLLKDEMEGRSVTERDRAFIETILTPHRQRIEAHLESKGGRVVSTAGDGHFLVFDNTVRAAQWAVDVQRDHRDNPIRTPDDGQVEVRVSIHVGVPQIDPADPNNFVGKSVDYASRLNDYAQGAQILVSRSVMSILHDVGLDGIAFHLHGRRHLKGIGHVEVHELLYDTSQPAQLRQQPSSNSDRKWTVLPTEFPDETSSRNPLSDTLLAAESSLKHIGNYELLERLGSGGMGDVYKGRHSQFGRVRAIKVIKPQFVAADNKDVIRRFYQEIKAVGALEHKNIVVAIDSSAPTDRLHYLVMEYIDGVALNDLVDQSGFLSVADACEVARQAARGLQYIHRNGMVHRDIKPSNLMLAVMDADGMATDSSQFQDVEGLQGVVKILDLGLALLSEDKHDRLTRFDNKAMGTGMYMPPEQWKTTSVDIRADIYSLGCSLYHLLAGHPPFVDSDLRPEKAHERSSVPPIRTGNTIPRKLWDVLRKMLAKKPEDRYATPAEVAAALLPFAEGHHLAILVQNYTQPDLGSSHIRTRMDSGARNETWLSRASHFYPSRRWLLHRGLPFFLVGAAFAALLWGLQQSRQELIADTMKRERLSLLKFAEEVAKDQLGEKLTAWFGSLQKVTADPKLIEMIERFDSERAIQELSDYPLAKWIMNERFQHNDTVPSISWFINDRHGRQIARHPLLDEDDNLVPSFLGNYAHRDYFHGEKKNRPKDDPEEIEPITSPNISAAYESTNSGKLKVAFSVPIWSGPVGTKQRRVIGVLSTSFNLGAFDTTGISYSENKQMVLVDMRDDYLKGSPMQGLILSHEHRDIKSIWNKSYQPRMDPQVVAAMKNGGDKFVAGYHDPLSLDSETVYWGAFEPLNYILADPETGRDKTVFSGWMVLVQTPASE